MTINFKNMSRTYVYPAVREWQEKALQAAETGDTFAVKKLQDSLAEFWYEPFIFSPPTSLLLGIPKLESGFLGNGIGE